MTQGLRYSLLFDFWLVKNIYNVLKKLLLKSFADIDDCLGIECFNNGRCVDFPGSYTCKCKEGFEGDHCEFGMLYTSIRLNYSFVTNISVQFNRMTCY